MSVFSVLPALPRGLTRNAARPADPPSRRGAAGGDQAGQQGDGGEEQGDEEEGERVAAAHAEEEGCEQVVERKGAAAEQRPRIDRPMPCRSTSRSPSPRLAPRAVRMPIARVRGVTE